MHIKRYTTGLEVEGDFEWDYIGYAIFDGREQYVIKYSNNVYLYYDFEVDGMRLEIEDFKKKYGCTNLQHLGKHFCRAEYIDRLHPEKSWTGHNPETLEKIKKYMEQIDGNKNGS